MALYQTDFPRFTAAHPATGDTKISKVLASNRHFQVVIGHKWEKLLNRLVLSAASVLHSSMHIDFP